MNVITAAALVLMAIAWPTSSFAQPAPEPSTSSAPSPSPHAHAHGAGQETPPSTRSDDEHADYQKPSTPYPLPPNVPPLTEADRVAAFPDVEVHPMHDSGVNYFVLFNQLEGLSGRGQTDGSWENIGWIGGDLNRFWFRTEGEGEDGHLERANIDLLYGRAIARWWELVAGGRQDFRPGPAQTWAGIGVQGLAPYWFEVEATAYVGASGRTLFQFEAEYELLLTNRLILQPRIEADIYGKSDPERGIGRGLSRGEAGLRLRYELKREFAPYMGVAWDREFFGTADTARAAGRATGGARVTFGVRVWR